jgi:16S rRNA (guanine966-N2)-methyltransferase
MGEKTPRSTTFVRQFAALGWGGVDNHLPPAFARCVRIIAGEFKSRALLTPRDAETVRPIPDRVKESLFSLLRGQCEDAGVLDLFAGTGAIGLEAVSRGAAWCVMVEKDRDVVQLLRRNVALLGVEDRTEVVQGDALGPGALARCPDPLNLVFMDPPYPLVRSELGYRRVVSQAGALIQRLAPGGFLVLRTPWPMLLDPPDDSAGSEERTGGKWGRRRRGVEASDDVDDRWTRGPRRDESDTTARGKVDGDEVEGNAVPGHASVPAINRQRADMKIPGAVGPETHTYHQMGVHLYMREARGGSGQKE